MSQVFGVLSDKDLSHILQRPVNRSYTIKGVCSILLFVLSRLNNTKTENLLLYELDMKVMCYFRCFCYISDVRCVFFVELSIALSLIR